MSDYSHQNDEAVELGEQLAQLAKAGLPLASGLRAAAEELPSMRAGRTLCQIAAQLEAGSSLEAALEAPENRVPAHLRRLILAGMHRGRLPAVLEQFVAVHRDRVELRRRVWLALAYPAILLMMLAMLLAFLAGYALPHVARIFDDLQAQVPISTQVVLWLATGPGRWVVLAVGGGLAAAVALVCLLPRPLWVRRVFYALPLIGPLWRYAGLVEFARLMEILLDQQIPLPEALRLTADGVHSSDTAEACRRAGAEVEAGGALADILARFWQFPAILTPFVQWAQQGPKLSEAFRAAAETFEARVRSQVTLLETVAPPIVFLVVIATVFVVVRATFFPLINFVQMLQ